VLDVAFTDDALSVSLRDGRIITVPLAWYPRLLNATPTQRKNWKIARGYGLHCPTSTRTSAPKACSAARPHQKPTLPRSDSSPQTEIPTLAKNARMGHPPSILNAKDRPRH